MIAVANASQVLESVHRVKAGAADFRTNLFSAQSTLDAWIARGELFSATGDGVSLFLKRDRGFWRLYFCARDLRALQGEVSLLPAIRTERMVTDLIGKEGSIDSLVAALEPAGFKPYMRMVRMSQMDRPEAEEGTLDARVAFAEPADCRALLALIERFFDPLRGHFLTEDEMSAAVAGRQVLVTRINGALAGLLLFETRGLTSTMQYWLVVEGVRDQRVGSSMIRRYFGSQPGVRRFMVWVAADNHDAIRKYGHYGYVPDGLVDEILVNEMIPT
jgi:hypothetical protein